MKEISTALVKAQRNFGPALKTHTNPAFRSKYADLSACIEAVIDALNNAGIALLQKTSHCEDGVIVETVFIHESGETMSSGPLHVPASKKDAQGYGSALSYARRYSLMAACGIAPEDDDGNAAVRSKPRGKGVAADVIEMSGGIAPERESELDAIASKVVDLFDTYGAQAAYERVEQEGLGDVEKIYIGKQMAPSIKNAIKAYSQSLHQQKVAA